MNLKDWLISVLLVHVIMSLVSYSWWPRNYGKGMRISYDLFMLGWNGQ